MPKVSVLMPVYKTQEEHLRAAIESILNQSFTDFEFLILDDCPTDTRETIVKSYNDPRIKYLINETNLGISKARNKLIDLAQGEYLAVFDHDDISLKDRLKKEVEFLDSHPDCGVVSAIGKYVGSNKLVKYPELNHDIKLGLMKYCAILHSASMLRKSVLTENNIRYEEEFSPAEDYALWCRLIQYTNFYNIQEVLFEYRSFPGNTSHLQAQKMFDATLMIYSFVRVRNKELFEECLLRRTDKKKYYLFGFLPLFKTLEKNDTLKIYLFSKILICTIKKKW